MEDMDDLAELYPEDPAFSLTRILRLDGKTNPNQVVATFDSTGRVVRRKTKPNNQRFVYSIDGKTVHISEVLNLLGITQPHLGSRMRKANERLVHAGHVVERTNIIRPEYFLEGVQVSRARLADELDLTFKSIHSRFSGGKKLVIINGKKVERRLPYCDIIEE
jgi:hypothetical protein